MGFRHRRRGPAAVLTRWRCCKSLHSDTCSPSSLTSWQTCSWNLHLEQLKQCRNSNNVRPPTLRVMQNKQHCGVPPPDVAQRTCSDSLVLSPLVLVSSQPGNAPFSWFDARYRVPPAFSSAASRAIVAGTGPGAGTWMFTSRIAMQG